MTTADEISWQAQESELLKAFFALKLDETIRIERRDETVSESSRFHRLFGKDGSAMAWRNSPQGDARPFRTMPGSKNPNRSLEKIDEPIFTYDEKAIPKHYYYLGQMLVVSDGFLSCLQSLDPTGFEHRPVSVRYAREFSGLPNYSLVLPLRVLDPTDLVRTTVELSYKQAPSSVVAMRRATFPDGYAIREDIPQDVHIFLSAFNADVLASVELIECLKKKKVKGLWAYRTEANMFGGGPRAPNASVISL